MKFTIHFATINTKGLTAKAILKYTFTIHFATINTMISVIFYQSLKIYNTLCYY